MNEKPDALYLANRVEGDGTALSYKERREAAAELRRLYVENFGLTSEVANKADYAARMYRMREEAKAQIERLQAESEKFRKAWFDACEKLEALASQEPVGTVQHLHELNDGWLSKLPIGTKLYAIPPSARVNQTETDLESCYAAWREDFYRDTDRDITGENQQSTDCACAKPQPVNVALRGALKPFEALFKQASEIHPAPVNFHCQIAMSDLRALIYAFDDTVAAAPKPSQPFAWAGDPSVQDYASTQPLDVGVPEGWKLVPVEPTLAMVSTGFTREGDWWTDDPGYMRAIYRAMLSESPEAPIPLRVVETTIAQAEAQPAQRTMWPVSQDIRTQLQVALVTPPKDKS